MQQNTWYQHYHHEQCSLSMAQVAALLGGAIAMALLPETRGKTFAELEVWLFSPINIFSWYLSLSVSDDLHWRGGGGETNPVSVWLFGGDFSLTHLSYFNSSAYISLKTTALFVLSPLLVFLVFWSWDQYRGGAENTRYKGRPDGLLEISLKHDNWLPCLTMKRED